MADDSIVERARACLGVPFRLHGRTQAGLDCIGLAALASGETAIPSGYGLRGDSLAHITAHLCARGWIALPVGASFPRGSLMILRPGPAQLHLGIWTGISLIHADARLRRVVERPGAPPWPVVSVWMRAPKNGD